jgi:hypothetical protein
MPKNLADYLSFDESTKFSGDLFGKIVAKIQKEKKTRQIKRKIYLWLVIFTLSLGAFVPTIIIIKNSLAHTGFIQYLSLLFSDTAIILSYWKSFGLSLLGALPLTGLILFSLVLAIFLESLKILTKNIKLFLLNRG